MVLEERSVVGMKWWRSKAYINKWYTLTKKQRHTLRLMRSRERREWWQLRREAHKWVLYKDLAIASTLFILTPLMLFLYLLYICGKGRF